MAWDISFQNRSSSGLKLDVCGWQKYPEDEELRSHTTLNARPGTRGKQIHRVRYRQRFFEVMGHQEHAQMLALDPI